MGERESIIKMLVYFVINILEYGAKKTLVHFLILFFDSTSSIYHFGILKCLNYKIQTKKKNYIFKCHVDICTFLLITTKYIHI